MKTILTTFALSLLLVTGAIAKGDNDDPVKPDPAGQFSSVVQLVETGKTDGFCTGFYIGKGVFVSAGHCVNDNTKSWGFLASNENGGTRFSKIDFPISSFPGDYSSQDFSVTFVDPEIVDDLVPLPLNCGYTPEIGDAISVEGFPEDMGRMVTVGQIAATKATPWKLWSKPVFRAQVPVSYGNSGSPVMHNGKVIGILVGVLPNDRVLATVQPISVVCKVLGLDNG
jgi:V8-like Glu-specific endopeptidase